MARAAIKSTTTEVHRYRPASKLADEKAAASCRTLKLRTLCRRCSASVGKNRRPQRRRSALHLPLPTAYCLLPTAFCLLLRLVPDVMTEVTVQWRLAQLVAIHAGDHGNFLLLPELIPVFYRTVAHRAFHAGTEVLLVAEVNKVRKLIHGSPRDKVVVPLNLGQSLDRGTFRLDALMAVHTIRDAGDCHLAAGSDRLVANLAFESCLNVLPVTERIRLRNRLGGSGKVLRFTSRTRRDRSCVSLGSQPCRTLPFREQGVGGQDGRGGGVRIEISPRPHRHHHELLFRLLPQIRHGGGVRVGLKFVDPERLAGAGIERAEAVIDGAANKDEPARRGDGPSEVISAGLGNPFCLQIIHNTQRHLPGDFSAF